MKTITRRERRKNMLEQRKLFREALQVTSEVETGLKLGVNKMPLRYRALTAARILMGKWR